MSTTPFSITDLKTQAKSLRTALAATGHAVSHSQSLELLARQMGHRDWNTLHAKAGNTAPAPYHLGQRVRGTYLGQPMSGEVIGLRRMGGGTWFQLTLRFDAPVDVSRFDSLSVKRTQVNAVVNRAGVTAEKTSDGQPHLKLDGPGT